MIQSSDLHNVHNVHPHYQIINGKRRCHTNRMSHEQHEAVKAHREARMALSNDDSNQRLFIGVVFHVLTPLTTRTQEEITSICKEILIVMNSGFSHSISPIQNIKSIEKGHLLTYDSSHWGIYEKQKQLSGSPNMEFLMAQKPLLSYIPFAHKHSGSDTKDMDYWDRLLKLQVSPAVDPRHLYNIWIVMDIKSVLLGYGNFPKVNFSEEDMSMDGFVYFLSPAPYDLHITAIHESGHVWGLNHLFNHDDITGQYDDGVEDTPYQDFPDFGPIWWQSQQWPFSVEKEKSKSYHLLMNYMGYVDDKCMYSFTKGQSHKIRHNALTVRSLWNLESSQVDGLRGGSPWVGVRLSLHRY